jgi:hypothetical protein
MDVSEWSTDRVERLAIDAEAEIARHRFLQAVALAELDRRQTASADGCRTLAEWTASRLDVSPETARDLVRVARGVADRPDLAEALAAGEAGFDRVAVLAGSDVDLKESFGWDIPGLRRAVARWKGIVAEPMPFQDRYLTLQPSLDQSRWRLWGQLCGDAGAVVDRVLGDRADSFPPLPDSTREGMSARRADALLTLCVDAEASDPDQPDQRLSREPLITVFVDATTSSSTSEARLPPEGREVGGPSTPVATVAAGPVLDSATLAALACEGTLEVTGITGDGTPVACGRRSRAIPGRLRRFVLHRDGGCVADGCVSRYRLQPHHVIPWSNGGKTDAENLATLCSLGHPV